MKLMTKQGIKPGSSKSEALEPPSVLKVYFKIDIKWIKVSGGCVKNMIKLWKYSMLGVTSLGMQWDSKKKKKKKIFDSYVNNNICDGFG